MKLLDFGLARSLPAPGSDETATQLTQAGTFVGTPRYMAPEQIRGIDIDTRADLFAVGAVLFEMLTGRPAFEGRTPIEVFHATLYEQPPALAGRPLQCGSRAFRLRRSELRTDRRGS